MGGTGTSGTSGYSGHLDYRGYKRTITFKDTYPDWMKTIIQFRNDSIKNEWYEAIKLHDVRGDTAEECNEKSRVLGEKVSKKLNELDEKYDKLDNAISEMISLIMIPNRKNF